MNKPLALKIKDNFLYSVGNLCFKTGHYVDLSLDHKLCDKLHTTEIVDYKLKILGTLRAVKRKR